MGLAFQAGFHWPSPLGSSGVISFVCVMANAREATALASAASGVVVSQGLKHDHIF